MSRIDIRHAHSLPKAKARKAIEEVAKKLAEKFEMDYGWDGDVLAFETRDEQAVHYLFEPDSFVPLAQVHTEAVRGVKVPRWSQHRPYDSDLDPLRKPAPARFKVSSQAKSRLLCKDSAILAQACACSTISRWMR